VPDILLPPMTTCIDWEQLSAVAEDWPADFVEIYDEFVASFPAELQDLRAAITSGDAGRTAAVAHRIKGSAANFGFTGASTNAAKIEAIAKTGQLEGIPVLAEGTSLLFDLAKQEVVKKRAAQ